MRTVLAAVVLLSLGATACGSAGGGGTSYRPDVISVAELDALGPSFSTFDAVRRLRPRWLQPRGSANFGGAPNLPAVFVDGSPFGGVGTLRNIRTEEVEELRFMAARDATTRYGTGYAGGIILLTSRSR